MDDVFSPEIGTHIKYITFECIESKICNLSLGCCGLNLRRRRQNGGGGVEPVKIGCIDRSEANRNNHDEINHDEMA